MKLYFFLIILAILFTFTAGYIFFTEISHPQQHEVRKTEVLELLETFKRKTPAKLTLNLNELFPVDGLIELIDPKNKLPQTHLYPLNEMRNLLNLNKTCKKANLKKPTHIQLQKAWQWELYQCKKTKKFPISFFKKPPYMHPLGNSYALLWLKSLKPDQVIPQINGLIPFFHVQEYLNLTAHGISLNKDRLLLTEFSSKALELLIKNSSPLLTSKSLLMAKIDNMDSTDVIDVNQYLVFDRPHWQKFIAKQKQCLDVKETSKQQNCSVTMGNLCCNVNLSDFYTFFRRYVVLFFAFSMILVFLIILLILKKIRMDRLEEERKRFALRTLTHELRTPIASLLLSLEELRNDFDNLSLETQQVFARISSDITRLKYLTEASRQYLTLPPSKGLIHLNLKKIESLNDFLESVLEPYSDKIQISPLSNDSAFTMDPYWASVCIKNLIENALHHGKPPIKFKIELKNSVLIFTVTDNGMCPFNRLEEMTREFSKADVSRGLGLGLNLVHKIILGMGGRLVYRPNPTTFTFSINDKT